MRLARGIVVLAVALATGVASAQENPGLQGTASAGVMGGAGPLMLGAEMGVAFTLPNDRIQIRYLFEYYGSGSHAVGPAYFGGCLDSCPSASGTSRLVGTSIGARFNVFGAGEPAYLLATVGMYQSRLSVHVAEQTRYGYSPAHQENRVDIGLASGGGMGVNFSIGTARLYGEIQFLYTDLGRSTDNSSFLIPISLGIGF